MPKIFIPTLDFLAAANIAENDLLILSDVDNNKTVSISVEGLAFAFGITSQGLFSTNSSSILARLAALENTVVSLQNQINTHSHP